MVQPSQSKIASRNVKDSDEIQHEADREIQTVSISPMIKQGEIDFLKQHGLLDKIIKKQRKFKKHSLGNLARNLLQEVGVINSAATTENVIKGGSMKFVARGQLSARYTINDEEAIVQQVLSNEFHSSDIKAKNKK